MAKNITIREGDTSKQFTAKKLKMNLVGGGTTNFVPEDEAIDYVDIKNHKFTENGEYDPSDFNADAFGEIVIAVPSGGGGEFAYVEAQQKNARVISDNTSRIVSTTYITLEEATQVRFYSTVNFNVSLTTEGTPATVTITYIWDDEVSTPITQTYNAGSQILTVDFLTPELSAGDHVFSMRVGISGGSLS